MTFRQSLFWDTDPGTIDIDKNAQYIIERILDFGMDNEVRWLFNTYDKTTLKEVVDNPRRLRPESKKLWKLILQN